MFSIFYSSGGKKKGGAEAKGLCFFKAVEPVMVVRQTKVFISLAIEFARCSKEMNVQPFCTM